MKPSSGGYLATPCGGSLCRNRPHPQPACPELYQQLVRCAQPPHKMAGEEEGEFDVIIFVVLVFTFGGLSRLMVWATRIPYSIVMFLFGFAYGIIGSYVPSTPNMLQLCPAQAPPGIRGSAPTHRLVSGVVPLHTAWYQG